MHYDDHFRKKVELNSNEVPLESLPSSILLSYVVNPLLCFVKVELFVWSMHTFFVFMIYRRNMFVL